jgi:hypothetical protein
MLIQGVLSWNFLNQRHFSPAPAARLIVARRFNGGNDAKRPLRSAEGPCSAERRANPSADITLDKEVASMGVAKGPEPRAHHFVPQCWLAGFTETGERNGRLWVTDLKKRKQWQSILPMQVTAGTFIAFPAHN